MFQERARLLKGTAQGERVLFARMAIGFSYALDAMEGNSEGHALRSCILGMKLGRRAGLSSNQLVDLFYALLFKDLGSSGDRSHAFHLNGRAGLEAGFLWRNGPSGLPRRRAMATIRALYNANPSMQGAHTLLHKVVDVQDETRRVVEKRRTLAYERAEALGLSSPIADTIAYVDARWDGKGTPAVHSFAIPLSAQIVKLAQTLDVLHELYGRRQAIDTVYHRCKGWFDPGLVSAMMLLFQAEEGWVELRHNHLPEYAVTLLPGMPERPVTDMQVDRLCCVFSEIIDSRSQHTAGHSAGVAQFAERIAVVLGLGSEDMRTLRHAALLHDIGNLTLPSALLDKPGTLTGEEARRLREAPLKTFELLSRIPGFEDVAAAAGSHRERLDGSGAPFGLDSDSIGLLSRILAVADVTEALAATRSYRPRLTYRELCNAMDEMTPHELDTVCVRALRSPMVMALVA